MAQRKDNGLDKIVLIFAIIDGDEEFVDDFVKISENDRYKFTPPDSDHDPEALWKGGQPSVPDGPLFCLQFGENMFSPSGWVAGSDVSDDCDLRLTRGNRSGISRQHFRIDINPIGRCPRITVLSRNMVRLKGDNGYKLDLARSQYENINSPVTIDTGVVEIRAWPPKLSKEGQKRYDENVKRFRNDLMKAQPVNPASHAGTSDVKFAVSGAVYKKIEGFSSGGSFGSVYKVVDLQTKKVFAAKVPHYKLSDGPDVNWKRWEILRNEFDNLVKLKHPHIVEAFEVVLGPELEPPWLIMEWVPDDLRSLLPLQDDQKPVLLGDVSAGLSFMHLQGYAHRDLKPDNILVGWNESMQRHVAKITDVGLSKYHAAGQMRTFIGSAAYMAPEIWQDERRYTNTVDLWALGIIALELLAECELSTEGLTKTQFKTWAAKTIWPTLETAPERFLPLLKGLLQEDPANRWAAGKVEGWLTKYIRPTLSGLSQPAGDSQCSGRFVRSAHPGLSTTRAVVSTESLPNTEPWGSPSDR